MRLARIVKIITKSLALFTMMISQLSFAGFNGITHHSLANCVNNKSIKLLISWLFMLPITVTVAADSPFPATMRGVYIVALETLPTELQTELLAKQQEENRQGYQLSHDNNAQFLLNITQYARQEISSFKQNNYGKYDTPMKSHFSDIRLAFPLCRHLNALVKD